MMQPGFSTAALIPLPHSHSDWRFPASLEDPAAAWALPRDVVQSFSCALQQEFSFPSRVFIPSFLEQTQLSGGQQDFLLQVPINQGYNYFLKAPFFFFFLFSLKTFLPLLPVAHPLGSITHLVLLGLKVSSEQRSWGMCLFISLRSVFFLEAEFCKQSKAKQSRAGGSGTLARAACMHF